MGIGKLWLTHGPGSPGTCPKAIAKDFLKWKREYPSASNEELLAMTLRNRMLAYRRLGRPALDDEEQRILLVECNGSLENLALFDFQFDNPSADEARSNSPEVYELALQVIRETVQKHVANVR